MSDFPIFGIDQLNWEEFEHKRRDGCFRYEALEGAAWTTGGNTVIPVVTKKFNYGDWYGPQDKLAGRPAWRAKAPCIAHFDISWVINTSVAVLQVYLSINETITNVFTKRNDNWVNGSANVELKRDDVVELAGMIAAGTYNLSAWTFFSGFVVARL